MRGTLTVEDALARMLAGSGLHVVSNGPRTFTVVQAPADASTGAATLPLVTVRPDVADLSANASGVVPAAQAAPRSTRR